MPRTAHEQLLRLPTSDLVALALEGLRHQGRMLADAIESTRARLDDTIDGHDPGTIYLVGCGDSYYAALCARHAFEQLTGLATVALESLEMALYTRLAPGALVVAISSGGQATGTLKAARVALKAGCDVVGVTSHHECRMVQEVPCLVTCAASPGNDQGGQVALALANMSLSFVALCVLAIRLGRLRGHLDDEAAAEAEARLRALPSAVDQAIGCNAEIRRYVEEVPDDADFYFLGAGPSHGVALFYQAKFFEQVQRPVYGVQLEEFLHEQFFLLQPGKSAQTWFVTPPGHSQERSLDIMRACREMQAHVVAVAGPHDQRVHEAADAVVPIAAESETFSPPVSAVPGEILGIHAFARWGERASFTTNIAHKLAIANRLTRTD